MKMTHLYSSMSFFHPKWSFSIFGCLFTGCLREIRPVGTIHPRNFALNLAAKNPIDGMDPWLVAYNIFGSS